VSGFRCQERWGVRTDGGLRFQVSGVRTDGGLRFQVSGVRTGEGVSPTGGKKRRPV
jgi:hypothetical protein